MISNSRYSVNFTLSVFEKTEAGKLIKEYEKNEYIEPYGTIQLLKKSAFFILLFAAMTNLIILAGLIFLQSSDPDFMVRAKNLSIATVSLVALSVALLYIYDFLMKKTMRKNYTSEIDDNELIIKLKINRSYIEQTMKIGSSKVFWNKVKKAYRKEGYLFIQREDNRCVVVPERIFKNESEVKDLYDFINEQISLHKENR